MSWKIRLFDVIFGVPALGASQVCLDSGLQQVTLVSGSKKVTFPFEYAVVEVLVDDSVETDSEDVISDSDVAPDVD